MKVAGPIAKSAIASVLVDGADAESAVRNAVVVIDAADMGDLDAELANAAREREDWLRVLHERGLLKRKAEA